MIELWIKLITDVAVAWVFPMTVVLASIMAILLAGSYWSRLGEERLLIQCALAAIMLHLCLFLTMFQLPRMDPSPLPSREVRVALELRGMEQETKEDPLAEHRAPLGATPKEDVIDSSTSNHPVEPQRPNEDVAAPALPDIASEPKETLPPIANDPLLPDTSPTEAPAATATLAETMPVRPTEEVARSLPEIAAVRPEDERTPAVSPTDIPPIELPKPAESVVIAPAELPAPAIASLEAPNVQTPLADTAPVRPMEELTRENQSATPTRAEEISATAVPPPIPLSIEPADPTITLPPAEIAAPTVGLPVAPAVALPDAPANEVSVTNTAPQRPTEAMTREARTDAPMRVEIKPSADPPAITLPPTNAPAESPSPEAMVLVPAPLPSPVAATAEAPKAQSPASKNAPVTPTETMKRNNSLPNLPVAESNRPSALPAVIPNSLPTIGAPDGVANIPLPAAELSASPGPVDAAEAPRPEQKPSLVERPLKPTPERMTADRTPGAPVSRPAPRVMTAPAAPTLPGRSLTSEMPVRPGVDTPLPLPTALPSRDVAAPTPAPSSEPAIVPKRFNLDVAMARPDRPVERSRTMEGPDVAKLNIKELVPRQTGPPSPVEASVNFWDNRLSPNRLAIVYRHGGSDETERAVNSALDWLAAHQSPDGRWDSDGFDAACPRGDKCDGHAIERDSDTGLTGLSLLAFLGAGHTHLEAGKHRETVRRGLSWLLRTQRPDGDLQNGGRIYCHSMATLALTEAYGMTKDQRLREPAQRAILWLADAQHPETGGWRYAPREIGDTSVYGWAVLSLRSAKQAKLDVPEQTWMRAKRWLPSISAGVHGGLASYRPGYPPSHAMTAEALFCRQVLGDKVDDKLVNEAADYVADRLPDTGDYHLYYWYYGTLSLFQIGGGRWDRWNHRLTATLLETQRQSGHAKGSWEPKTPFGVDGGRIFTTAVSAMCLEIYYRYLPLYEGANRKAEEP